MGIPGLLKGLQFCSQKRHIRDFSNKVLAVDASSWLHKAVYSVSERYVESLDKGRLDHTSVQVATKYIVSRCQELLLNANIRHIYLCLDGKRCPLKAQTNQDREERRQKNLADARAYKRAGRPDKAQEKYKACIKISSQMANAVANEVTRRFANDGRVTCVYSPYEADAQLVKLCMDGIADAVVTEDSDVLVYSVSCNFSFPILYKLERDTGDCDVITMEWLLNPQAQPNWTLPNAAAAGTKQKNVGALESILKSLVSRQSRRPGVGARLFVQSCVLAGCDYCPSELNGVGLVTAFKLVRDNAHRSAADRFQKILKYLSKKARGNINLVEYEELLSKSEAVFWYHPVLDLNSKTIIPLVSLQTETAVAETDLQVVADTRPSLYRFDGDWSFLGDMTENVLVAPVANLNGCDVGDDESIDTNVPVSEIVVKKKPSKKTLAKVYDGGAAAVSEVIEKSSKPKPKPINPYAIQKKRPRTDGREPLSRIGAATKGTNVFSNFSHRAGSRVKNSTRSIQHRQQIATASAPSAGLSMYNTNGQDPRFVKRDFNNPKSYAKLQQEKKASKRSKSRGSSLRNPHAAEGTSIHEPSTQSHSVALTPHMEQNIFAVQESSFCYSEIDQPQVDTRSGSMGLFQERRDEVFGLTEAAGQRQEMEYTELGGNEPRYQDEADPMPYGNPDFAGEALVNHTDLSGAQQSMRRVTFEDAASDALYNEFDAAASRNMNPSSHANEYKSDVEESAAQTSKYFSNGENPSHPRYPLSGTHEANDASFYHDEDTIDEFAETSFARSLSSAIVPPGPLYGMKANHSRRDNSYSNDNLDLSSCEDISSPTSQYKTHSGFSNAFNYGPTEAASQEVMIQDDLSSRAGLQQLAPNFRQSPPSTFKTGTTPPVEPRSPLSVTSPEKRGAKIPYQTMPAARSRWTNKAPKRGLITSFFPSTSSSPQDENEFARF